MSSTPNMFTGIALPQQQQPTVLQGQYVRNPITGETVLIQDGHAIATGNVSANMPIAIQKIGPNGTEAPVVIGGVHPTQMPQVPQTVSFTPPLQVQPAPMPTSAAPQNSQMPLSLPAALQPVVPSLADTELGATYTPRSAAPDVSFTPKVTETPAMQVQAPLDLRVPSTLEFMTEAGTYRFNGHVYRASNALPMFFLFESAKTSNPQHRIQVGTGGQIPGLGGYAFAGEYEIGDTAGRAVYVFAKV